MFDLDAALREAVRLGASDLHLKVPAPPHVRIEGELVQLPGYDPLSPDDLEQVVEVVVASDVKREQFERQGSADLSYFLDEGRFRVAAFRQRGVASFVFRSIPEAPEPEGLGIPEVVLGWADVPRGLVIVTGPTGSGKSTTSAVILGLINERRSCHILTIEDPIEFVHHDRRALVSQREIGMDAASNADALRAGLRQDPDVMLIGEVRDEDTAETAMRAAETGHLVLCTMHTSDAAETIQRVVGLFPPERATLARQMLASTLIGIISQRLVPGTDGTRKLNAEVLVNSSRLRDMIADGRPTAELTQAIAEGDYYGMMTFDQSLLEFVRAGQVSEEDAVTLASNPHDFKLMLSGAYAPRTGSFTTGAR